MKSVAIGLVLVAFVAGCQSDEAKTANWLQTQGMSPSSAQAMASNKPALRQYIMNRQYGGNDDEYCRSLGAASRSDAYVQCRVSVANNRSQQVERNIAANRIANAIPQAAEPSYRPTAPEIAPWPGTARPQ